MKIIRPSWKYKKRNIDILVKYLNGKKTVDIAQEYKISRQHILMINKIQLKGLLGLDDNFNIGDYKGNENAILLANKYKEFINEI